MIDENGNGSPQERDLLLSRDIPCLDKEMVRELRELPGENGGTLFDEAVDVALEQAPDFLDEIREAKDAGDYEVLGSSAHKLKGCCSTLGGLRVAELCHKIAVELRGEKRGEKIDEIVQAVEKEFVCLSEALRVERK